MKNQLTGQCISEFIGTFILVFFGVGSVHTAVSANAQIGLWQVAVVWGIGISLAIYTTSAISGAHINPAITAAMAIWRGFPKKKIIPYMTAQLAGAFAGAAVLHGLFCRVIAHFEKVNHIIRGGPGSELSAMMYGEYFPNPAIIGTTPQAYAQVTLWQAFWGEAVGTFFLALFVFAVTELKNKDRPGANLFAIFIGLTVSIVISIIAPLTQAGLNPARDFGPRLFAYFVGWGRIAIPGPRGGFFTVYILGPVVGALIGGFLYQYLIRVFLPTSPAPE